MATLNLAGASLYKKYKVKAGTDVTGFGILGHANYLAVAQKLPVEFKIHTLPILKNLIKLEKQARDFKFKEGLAAETSGGLLVAVKDPEGFIRDYQLLTGEWGWVIGEVVSGNKRGAKLEKNLKIIEV